METDFGLLQLENSGRNASRASDLDRGGREIKAVAEGELRQKQRKDLAVVIGK